MRRRALLATAATSLPAMLTGCTGPGGPAGSNAAAEAPTARFELMTIADAKLPTKVLYTVRLWNEAKVQLLDRILEGGATMRALRPPLLEGEHIAYHDKGVYECSYDVTDETPATRYSVKVDIVTDSVTESEAIRFADIPEVDQDEFAAHGLADGEPVGIGTTFLYTDAEREQSVLVPESAYSYITWENGAEAEWSLMTRTTRPCTRIAIRPTRWRRPRSTVVGCASGPRSTSQGYRPPNERSSRRRSRRAVHRRP